MPISPSPPIGRILRGDPESGGGPGKDLGEEGRGHKAVKRISGHNLSLFYRYKCSVSPPREVIQGRSQVLYTITGFVKLGLEAWVISHTSCQHSHARHGVDQNLPPFPLPPPPPPRPPELLQRTLRLDRLMRDMWAASRGDSQARIEHGDVEHDLIYLS